MTTDEKAVAKKESYKTPGYLSVSKIALYILYGWTFVGVILLGVRTFLLLFSANPATPFVDFVYRTSTDYLAPFRGIWPPKAVGETGYLDIAAIFAIIMYLLIMWGFRALIEYITRRIARDQAAYEREMREQQRAALKK